MGANRSLRSWLASLLLASNVAAARAAIPCGPGTFIQAIETRLPQATTQATTGDFNADGKLDFATWSQGSQSFSVYLGLGDGRFLLPKTTSTASTPRGLAVADFDGDGKLDVAIAEYRHIETFKGNNDGTFQAAIDNNFEPVDQAFSLPIARDFDQDGHSDLLAFGFSDSTVFLKGRGDGTLAAPVAAVTGLRPPFVVEDLDDDGELDLIASDSIAGTVRVALGHGDGTFGEVQSYVAGSNARSVATGDFDSDSEVDLAVAVVDHVATLKGNGDGTFQASILHEAGPVPVAVAVADFDGDGDADLLVGDSGAYGTSVPQRISVLLGHGNGSFSAPEGYLSPPPAVVFTGDFNADGKADAAGLSTGVYLSESFSVLLGDGTGRMAGVSVVPLKNPPHDSVVGDLDGDGKLDIVTAYADFESGVLETLLGDGRGGFHGLPTQEVDDRPVTLVMADFNGDDQLDLAGSGDFDLAVWIRLGNGDGTFQNAGEVAPALQPTGHAVGDWNADGRADLVFTSYNSEGALELSSLLGNGDGSFQSPKVRSIEFLAASILGADLNGDGVADLVVSPGGDFYAPNYVLVLLGAGEGSFAAPVEYPTDDGPVSAAAADFDEDGAVDLAIANGSAGNVSILFGNGDGSFAPALQIGQAWFPLSIVTADFDGDGHQDFATSNAGIVALYRGIGNGAFHSPTAYGVVSSGGPLMMGDFRGTGALDLAVASADTSSISILLNRRLAARAPTHAVACDGAPATLRVVAAGLGALGYQWRKDETPLSDGGNVSGATSAILTIGPTGAADAGSYDVVITDTCGALTTGAVALIVSATPAAPLISAPISVPPGAIGVLASVPSAAGHTYLWSLEGGAITDGQGTSQITFTAGTAGTTMSLEVTDALGAGCVSEPASAKVQVDFLDVPPSHLFHNAIVRIARAGITSGCGGGRYCPELPVTRSTVSVFILRGEHGGDYLPPDATGTVFGDVTTSTFLAKWIEQFGSEGISTGCGGGNFCPNGPVNRATVSVFLLRGKHGAAYDPPSATGTVFGDVAVDTFLARWMEQLSLEGITGGCGGGNFCPNSVVNRGEMAALVRKTFGL